MISRINVKVSNIEGAGATFYDMKDNTFNQLIFQNVFGASFSGAGITYSLERDTFSLTVSSQRIIISNSYTYDSTSFLNWPSSSTGYTLYSGSFTSIDDGYSSTAVTLPTAFSANNVSSTSLYLSTNGYFTLASGAGNILSTPQGQSNPAAMAGNTTDLWLQQGLSNSDGDIQNFYYQTGTDGDSKYFAKLLVYCGTYGSPTFPKSYIINFYRDSDFQWLEARAKLNAAGNIGPYNSINVSQPSSTTSKVWRGDLTGRNWIYMGTGSVKI